MPAGVDLAAIPDDVLRVYELATTPATAGDAINNWVLSGARTGGRCSATTRTAT